MENKETEKEKLIDEEKLKKEARKISIKEGSTYGVQDGFGLKYVTPYALAVGSNNFYIGLLNSIPSLLGNFSQIFTFNFMSRFSRKKIVFWGVLMQGIMWLLMIGVGFFYFNSWQKEITPLLLVITYSILIAVGTFIGPAWTSWMRDLVPENKGDFLGKRGKIVGLVTLGSMFLAGFILDYFKKTKIFYGFIILFFIAFVFRSISALLFLRQYEPASKNNQESYFSLAQFLKKMHKNNFGKFVILVTLINFATMIASPFFGVYMLKNLGFSYVKFITITMVSLFVSLMVLPFWGRIIDDYGSVKVLKLTGMFVPLIPIFWLASPFLFNCNLFVLTIYLFFIEAFSGFMWAGFNLAANNFIYDAVTKERMVICVAYSNVLNGIGVFIGSTLGGFISSMSFNILFLNSILFVFLLSGIARAIVYFVMIPKIKEVGKIKKTGLRKKILALKFFDKSEDGEKFGSNLEN